MRNSRIFLFLFFLALLPVITTPAVATPISMLVGGQVTGMNETGHSLTIIADCDRFSCSRLMTGTYAGDVTSDVVFTMLRPGDDVALMYKSWMGQYPCDEAEYKGQCEMSAHDPIPVGRWAGISRVVQEEGTGRWLTTDVFGDPDESRVQLVNNYSLEYEAGPELATCPVSQPVWECNAGYVNISILHGTRTITESRVLRNTTFVYEDPADKTNITLRFLGGKATPQHIVSPGGAPYADMEVHVQPTPVRTVPDISVLPGSSAPSTTQPAPLPLFISAVALCIAGIVARKRM
ncbi:MAG: hypothetical protein M0Q92_09615 [Methanoregula sp.]|nr:hypothetical protein [Methanoregula sp.]